MIKQNRIKAQSTLNTLKSMIISKMKKTKTVLKRKQINHIKIGKALDC